MYHVATHLRPRISPYADFGHALPLWGRRCPVPAVPPGARSGQQSALDGAQFLGLATVAAGACGRACGASSRRSRTHFRSVLTAAYDYADGEPSGDKSKTGSGGDVSPSRSPNIIWPARTKVLTMRTKEGSTVKAKIAVEEKLFFWAEDTSTRRQFQAIWTAEECQGVCEGLSLSPSELAELLVEAFSGEEEASAEVDVTNSQLIMNISWEGRFLQRQFMLQVSEKKTSQTDRLEARMDEAEARLTHHETLLSKPDALLSTWKLDVALPVSEGAEGSFALMGNFLLIQDTDFKEKKTGVVTRSREMGSIQATFEKPVYIKSIKIAPFPKRGWTYICESSAVSVQEFSLEDAEWKEICSLPRGTQEVEIAVNAKGLAWRLCGQSIRISKFIFK